MCVCVRGCGRCLNNCLAHCRQFGDDLRSVVPPPPPPPPGPFATFQSGIAIVSHALRVLGKTISFFSARRGYVLYSCKTSIFKTLFFKNIVFTKSSKIYLFSFLKFEKALKIYTCRPGRKGLKHKKNFKIFMRNPRRSVLAQIRETSIGGHRYFKALKR